MQYKMAPSAIFRHCYYSSYHDTVGLSDSPEVDLAVISAGDQHSPRFVTQSQAVDIRRMSHKLL